MACFLFLAIQDLTVMKKMKYLSVVLFVALFSFAFTSCVIHENDDYYNPQPVGYTNVFNEEFNNDNRGWTFDDPADSAYGFVTTGMYKFVDESKTGGGHQAVVSTGVNTSRNFLIKTSMKSDYAMAVVFGVSNTSAGYSFFVDNAGYFAVYKEGTSPQTIVDWTQSNEITSSWNDVEVEQVGEDWVGYINNKKVFTIPARVLVGSKIGYMVLANTVGYADYLTVKW